MGRQYELGHEGSQLNALLEKINATSNIFVPDSKDYWDSNSEVGLKSRSSYKPADLFGNLIMVTLKNRHKCTYPFDLSCLTFLVPKASRIPQYMNIILPFEKLMWVSYLATCVVLVLVCKVIKLDTRPESDTLLETLRILLTGATLNSPSSFSHRLYLVMCLWFSMLTLNSYMGALASYLTVPQFYPDIDTFKQLYESGLEIAVQGQNGFNEGLTPTTFLNTTDKMVLRLIKRAHFTHDFDKVMNQVAHQRNLSMIITQPHAVYFQKQLKYFSSGYPLMHVARQCAMTVNIAFEFLEKSPFERKFSFILGSMFEAGLTSMWSHEVLRGAKFNNAQVEKPYPKPLTVLIVNRLFQPTASDHAALNTYLREQLQDNPIVNKFIREVKSHDNDSVLKQQIRPFPDDLAWHNCQGGYSESGNRGNPNKKLFVQLRMRGRSRNSDCWERPASVANTSGLERPYTDPKRIDCVWPGSDITLWTSYDISDNAGPGLDDTSSCNKTENVTSGATLAPPYEDLIGCDTWTRVVTITDGYAIDVTVESMDVGQDDYLTINAVISAATKRATNVRCNFKGSQKHDTPEFSWERPWP
uniref:Ionotropic glutamate receptor C-terminal domain-containing protein n=1 Tax=Timema monikensis TaxID=170555 RepID=A0A7R9EFA6_9NEOP|nr:unnamed protein product [Timema monikensis]